MEDGFRQEVKYIPLDQIDASPRYQRVRTSGSLAAQIKDIADNFNPDLCQIPDVWEKNGTALYLLADGGGRIGALRRMGVHGTHFRILRHKKETMQSKVFIDLQKKRRRVSSLDEFIANSFDPSVKSIKAILRDAGLAKLDPHNGRESYPRISGGVDVMLTIFAMSKGDDRLRRALRMASAWSRKNPINGVMLHTLLLLITGQAELESKIIETLTRVSIIEATKSVLEKFGKLKTLYLPPKLAEYVANKHNKGRPQHRVELDNIDRVQTDFLKCMHQLRTERYGSK